MKPELWMMFFVAYLVMTLSPGPNVLLVLKNSIRHGWKSAFITVLGNLSCQLLIVCLVAVGVGQLIQELPFFYSVQSPLGGGSHTAALASRLPISLPSLSASCQVAV